MNDNLPRGYDQWRTASPPEFDEEESDTCECGHDINDHNMEEMTESETELVGLIEDMEKLLGEYLAEFGDYGNPSATQIIKWANDYLASCQVCGCNCREFKAREGDPDDDGDYAFDAARDNAMEDK